MGTRDREKGFLYVIAAGRKKEGNEKNYSIVYYTKGEMEGFWTWVSIESEHLKRYN